MLILWTLLLAGLIYWRRDWRFLCLESLALSALILVSLIYGLDLLGVGLVPVTALGATTFGALGVFVLVGFVRRYPMAQWDWLTISGIVALLGSFGYVYSDGYVLVARDSIQVPTFAKYMIEAGSLTPDTLNFDLNGRVFKYPPGFCILTMPIVSLLGDLEALHFFKWVNVLFVALTPLTVAVGLYRLVPGAGRFSWYLAAAMLVFVLVERTHATGLFAAGKNSQMLSLFFLPIVLAEFGRIKKVWSGRFGVAVLGGLGLFLVHYNCIFSLGFFVLGLVAIRVLRTRTWVSFLPVLALAGCGVLFVPQYLTIQTALTETANAGGIDWELIRTTFTHPEPLLVNIISAQKWQLQVFLILALVTLWVMPKRRHQAARSQYREVLGGLLLAILGSVLLAANSLPVFLDPDYVRWYLYGLTGMGLTLVVVTFFHYGNPRRSFLWRLLPIAIAVVAVGENSLLSGKLNWVKRWQPKYATTEDQLNKAKAVFQYLESRGKPCYLVTNTIEAQPNKHYGAVIRSLDYSSYFTGCIIVNGYFLGPALPRLRDERGFPEEQALVDFLGQRGPVFYIGREDLEAPNYQHVVTKSVPYNFDPNYIVEFVRL